MQAKLKLEEEEARPSGYRYAALVSYVFVLLKLLAYRQAKKARWKCK